MNYGNRLRETAMGKGTSTKDFARSDEGKNGKRGGVAFLVGGKGNCQQKRWVHG